MTSDDRCLDKLLLKLTPASNVSRINSKSGWCLPTFPHKVDTFLPKAVFWIDDLSMKNWKQYGRKRSKSRILTHYSTYCTRWRSGWGTTLQTGRSRVRFPMVSLDFFIDIIFPSALWPWGRLSLLQKRVPGIFPGGKGGRCVGLTILPLSSADCLKIWEPQPPGTLRACQGL
jgi:hypothetical protein